MMIRKIINYIKYLFFKKKNDDLKNSEKNDNDKVIKKDSDDIYPLY